MRIERLGPSMTVLHTNNGKEVLFSYETPVAVIVGKTDEYGHLVPGRIVKTKKWFSRTTSSHITKWLEGAKAEEVPHSEILELVEGN